MSNQQTRHKISYMNFTPFTAIFTNGFGIKYNQYEFTNWNINFPDEMALQDRTIVQSYLDDFHTSTNNDSITIPTPRGIAEIVEVYDLPNWQEAIIYKAAEYDLILLKEIEKAVEVVEAFDTENEFFDICSRADDKFCNTLANASQI